MGLVAFCSERHFLGDARGTFFYFEFAFILQLSKILNFPKTQKTTFFVKKIIFLKKIGKNRKKYHGQHLIFFIPNKMRPFPSKSVQNYGLGLRQQIKNKESRYSGLKFFFIIFLIIFVFFAR